LDRIFIFQKIKTPGIKWNVLIPTNLLPVLTGINAREKRLVIPQTLAWEWDSIP
jgi:hypothetical protein